MWVDSEKVLIGTRVHGALSTDNADFAIACSRDGASDCRADDLNNWDVIALAGIVQEGRRGGIASDDDHLAAAFYEFICNGGR